MKELTPDHVRIYIGNLSDGPSEGEEHIRSVINHYAVIHTWIRWLYAQKFLIERSSSYITPPRFTNERGGFMYHRQSQFSPYPSSKNNVATKRALGVEGLFL